MSNSFFGFEKMLGNCISELGERAHSDESVVVFAWINGVRICTIKVCEDLPGFLAIHGCDSNGIYKTMIIPTHQVQFELAIVKNNESNEKIVGFKLPDRL